MAARAVRVRVAVCLHDDGRVLLVRHRKDGRDYWLLPGGGVEVGETLVEAARRELREETSLEVEIGPLMILCEAVEPGGRHLVMPVFAGRRIDGELRAVPDGRLVDAAWHPLEDLPALEMYPPIGGAVRDWCADGGRGGVMVLGNVWRPMA